MYILEQTQWKQIYYTWSSKRATLPTKTMIKKYQFPCYKPGICHKNASHLYPK